MLLEEAMSRNCDVGHLMLNTQLLYNLQTPWMPAGHSVSCALPFMPEEACHD